MMTRIAKLQQTATPTLVIATALVDDIIDSDDRARNDDDDNTESNDRW